MQKALEKLKHSNIHKENKKFSKATKKDIERVVGEINRRDSPWTKKDYKVTLKKFYKWLNNGEYPETVKWIKTRIKLNEEKFKDSLITEEEVKHSLILQPNSQRKMPHIMGQRVEKGEGLLRVWLRGRSVLLSVRSTIDVYL